MFPEQQRFWIALLNLQRTWTTDESAHSFIPPRHRDFGSPPAWPRNRALAYLLNNLELIRDTYRLLEAGRPIEFESLNHGLGDLQIRLQAWPNPTELRRAANAKAELGGRLEVLQVTPDMDGFNPGTRYIRATVQRSLYYFALYVDDRLSDPLYPEVSPGRMHVREREDGSGDLVLIEAAEEPAGGAS